MDTAILEDLGLTNAEIKVYLALLELGTCTAGPIIDKTGLQNSVVHMTLHKLLEKGFITYILKGKVRHYQSSDPRNISKFIEEKKQRFEKLLPELMVKQQYTKNSEAEIYEGFQGFKNMLYEFIKDGKPGDVYQFFTFYSWDTKTLEVIHDFYREFEKERIRRGFIIQGIANSNIKSQFKGRDMRTILFVDFPIPNNVSIFNDLVVFTPPPGEKQVSFLIRSKELADSFRQYHQSIWKKYKK